MAVFEDGLFDSSAIILETFLPTTHFSRLPNCIIGLMFRALSYTHEIGIDENFIRHNLISAECVDRLFK